MKHHSRRLSVNDLQNSSAVVKDEFRDGYPSTTVKNKNIDAVRRLIKTDRHVTCHEIRFQADTKELFHQRNGHGQRFSSPEEAIETYEKHVSKVTSEEWHKLVYSNIPYSHTPIDPTMTRPDLEHYAFRVITKERERHLPQLVYREAAGRELLTRTSLPAAGGRTPESRGAPDLRLPLKLAVIEGALCRHSLIVPRNVFFWSPWDVFGFFLRGRIVGRDSL
ncbi:hypothetical protein EVAR_22040_1 [Eumeta japonica]|uniref:Uncharacterized protein n=1 Tax=Eumeta variegata TaxID=151549 RepID=A0A4C1USK4_EUMVA|nr:hypothetical protein EVAR_22040_1 [Eumeta japonica]